MASWNFCVEAYLRTVLAFTRRGGGELPYRGRRISALSFGKVDRQTFLQPYVDSIRAQFKAA